MSFPDGTEMAASGGLRLKRLANAIPPSYSVFKIDSTWYGETNIAGGTSYNGPNAQTVIQDSYDALSAGQTLFIHSNGSDITGITGLVFGTDDTCVVGEGQETVLAGNPVADLVTVSGERIKLADFQVDGYGSNNPTSGIKITASKAMLYNIQVKGINNAAAIHFNTAGSSASLYAPRIVNCLKGIQMDANSNNINIYGGAMFTNVANATLINLEGGDTLKIYGTDFAGLVASTTAIYVNYVNSIMRIYGARFETLLKGIEWNAGQSDYIAGCSFATVTTPITSKPATSTITGCYGYITENSGTGTLPNAGPPSTVVVAHGLDVTPTVDQIVITLAENPTASPGAVWVDTIGAANFTVNCENDPGVSALDFGWKVDASK